MKKILVVDDSKTVRNAIKHELSGKPYEILEAENGKIAIQQIQKFKPDLITLDVDMPVMNGYEVCTTIRQKGIEIDGELQIINTPVIFISARDTRDDRDRGFEAGGIDFILKPFMKGEVVDAIARMLIPKKTLSGMTALVVDDSRGTRFLINKALVDEGINIIEAEDGLIAFNIVKQDIDKIDIIITDNHMPEMNGIEFCQKVRNELGHQSIPIIFLSGQSEKDKIISIFKAGATDYLSKPFIKEELISRITIHLTSLQLLNELNKRVNELKELNQLKDSVLSIASHDLRSPLNGIIGSAELLLMEEGLIQNEEATEWIKNISDSGYKLLDLLNELLDISRFQSTNYELKFEKLDINDILQESVDDLKPMAIPKKININSFFSESLPKISSDKNALLRIFNNLLSNAIKFTNSEGQVIISSSVQKDEVFIKIKDTGIGIPEDKIKELFNKFTSISREGTAGEASTGLGMSIIKELVEKLQGRITVDSEQDKGTTFYLYFPTK